MCKKSGHDEPDDPVRSVTHGGENSQVADNLGHESYYTPRMLVLYFVLTYAITWVFMIPTVTVAPESLRTALIIPAAFGPFLSAVIVIRAKSGWSGLRNWLSRIFASRIPISLYLAGALLLPAVIAGLHFSLYTLLGGEYDFSEAWPWFAYPIALIPTALLTGGNEEPGWRGFALPGLLKWFHPVLAAVILGVIHSAWHLPFMSHYDTSFGWYLFNVIPLTFILNWLYFKSRMNVIPVMLLHASTNVIGRFIPTPTDVLDGLGTFMFLRAIVYWAMAILLIVATKGRLGYDPVDAKSTKQADYFSA
jgi:membrane protease YdiL (CAAX protease family)